MVVMGSCLQALGVVPETILSDKSNFLNKYLAKLSWMWTLIWLIAAVSIPAALYSALTLGVFARHMGRVAVGHAVWYCGTSTIAFLGDYSGNCTSESLATAKACVRAGYVWTCFDISGHIFLLSLCVFVITEEAANIRAELWARYTSTILQEHDVFATRGEKLRLVNLYNAVDCFVAALELMGMALVLVWSFMMLTTSLYFHTYVEKFLGWAMAVGAWYVTYGILYGSSWFLPCDPNYGILHPARSHVQEDSEDSHVQEDSHVREDSEDSPVQEDSHVQEEKLK